MKNMASLVFIVRNLQEAAFSRNAHGQAKMKELPHELVKAIDERAEKIKDFFLIFSNLAPLRPEDALLRGVRILRRFLTTLRS